MHRKKFADLHDNQYFVARKYLEKAPIKNNEVCDFFDDYWDAKRDPDNVIRDKFSSQEIQNAIKNLHVEIDFIDKLDCGKILDIGCGPGYFLSILKSGWEKFGLEVSKPAAKFASKYASIFNGTLENASYESNFFDVIFCHHVIEHVIDPVSFINEIRRILKIGGRLIIATPDFDSGCARKFKDRYRLLHDKTHISLFSRDSFTRILRDHGFNITATDYPFFETTYCTKENLGRMIEDDGKKISPAFYGNLMTFYCQKLSIDEIRERNQKQLKRIVELSP